MYYYNIIQYLYWKVYSLINLKWKWKVILSISFLFNAREIQTESRKIRTGKRTVQMSKYVL